MDREAIAQAAGLPEGWGQRLVGETEAELQADAASLAPNVKPPEPEHVQLARRAIAAAQSKRERDMAIVAALHPETGEEGSE